MAWEHIVAKNIEDAYSVDNHTGCWEWLRAKASNGYGQFRYNGKTTNAHCWFYEKYKGPIPKGKEIDHLCRNRGCVNPEHLEAVTHAENTQRGSLTPLTRREVAEIRWLRQLGLTCRVIGEIFNVSRSCVSEIIHQRRWKNI